MYPWRPGKEDAPRKRSEEPGDPSRVSDRGGVFAWTAVPPKRGAAGWACVEVWKKDTGVPGGAEGALWEWPQEERGEVWPRGTGAGREAARLAMVEGQAWVAGDAGRWCRGDGGP